ncbi:amidohydrolase family protein [Desulfotruncus alcoholivorax]|uniref:amidohydrolase family protein n=1 Tax=Desulfotruncus alcoholivorax TaxID=265477 RepID=UPI0003FF4380|nr:amidohydrolase family protein [Desulfotruncus alcoholivorax]
MSKPKYFIDSHAHLMTPYRVKGGIKWIRKAVKEYEQLDLETPAGELLQHMKTAGADYIINYFYPLQSGESREINRWQREFADRHPEVIPFASLHPGDEDKEEIIRDSLENLKLTGFKFHPYVQRFKILDPGMLPVYAVLQEIGCPVNMHTGFSKFYGMESLEEEFLALLARFPRLKVIASHMLFGDMHCSKWDRILEQYPNLFLDATNTLSFCRPGTKLTGQIQEIISKYSGRMVFGSDYPMGMAYPVKILYDLLEQVCPDHESFEDLAWRTAAGLVKLNLH